MATTFTGSGVALYRAAAIRTALALYAKTGLKVNRAYTPTAMMRAASSITGRTFKARDYAGAIAALEAWIATAPKDGVQS